MINKSPWLMSEDELLNEVILLRKFKQKIYSIWWDSGWKRYTQKYSMPEYGFKVDIEDVRFKRKEIRTNFKEFNKTIIKKLKT